MSKGKEIEKQMKRLGENQTKTQGLETAMKYPQRPLFQLSTFKML